jgi:hypothetical protein
MAASKIQSQTNLTINRAIIDSISPISINFATTDIQWGDNLCRVIGIQRYPQRVGMAWLAEIANMEGVVLKVHAQPTDPAVLIESLNKAVPELGSRLEMRGKTSLRQRAEQAYQDAQTLLRKIDQEQELVLKCTITMVIYAPDLDELQRRTKRVIGKLGGKRMKGAILVYRQEQGMLHSGPYGSDNEEIKEQISQLLPAGTLAASLPFSNSGINDGKGIRLGRDTSGGVMLIDQWSRGAGLEDRTNNNWTVLGVPGVGKSTAIKHMLTQEWSQNVHIIIIDPEREYKEMCETLGGQWVNAGGGEIINPLQIKEETSADDDINTAGMTPIDRHIQTLKTFFKLCIADLSDIDVAYLENGLLQTYGKHSITKESNPALLKDDDYPIMEDLYNTLKGELKESSSEEQKAVINRLLALMRGMVGNGANSGLWNSHTNVWLHNDFIVVDTHDLQESDDSTKRAQYFNVLTSCWQLLQENRVKGGRMILAIDEAYLLVDPKVPQALNYLKNVSKRIRKYGGGLCVISHTVNDFLDPAVRREGEALLENSCYKLLMGADGKNLEEMRSLYNLTEGQCELLAAKQRGRGLFIAGSKRAEAIIEVTDKELEIFGKGGGR